MSDGSDSDRRANAVGPRLRGAAERLRLQGAASLRGLRRSAASTSDRLRRTSAGERLGEAVETRRLLKKAEDAQRRGNASMAYRLLEPEARARPDDVRVVTGFWRAALACERAEDAVPALGHVIRRLAATGGVAAAAELWVELHETVPSARVDPGALVRITPAIRSGPRADLAGAALRDAVDPSNVGATPGIAVRVAELAREIEPEIAVRAARLALASPELHPSKCEHLLNLVAELEPAAPAEDAAAYRPIDSAAEIDGELGAHPLPATLERAVDAASIASEAAVRFAGIKVTEAMPTCLAEEGIGLQVEGGRKVRVQYLQIEAVAVAEVDGLAAQPVVVVDLALNWTEALGDAVLRVVRLRSDGFDARMVIQATGDEAATFRAFLAELIARSNALALPDSDAAPGVAVQHFESVEAYERIVLGAAR